MTTRPNGTAEDSTRTHPQLTLLAALLAMLGPFSIDTYLPSFPDIELEFGVGRALLSQSIAVYMAAFAIATLFWGPLADRIGRRRVILASVTLFALASAGCALAGNIHAFLLMRTLQGLAASGSLIAGRAMIRDAHDARAAHRAMSQVTLLFALAPAVAPVLGGWLHDAYGWRSVFWFLGGYAGLLIALACRVPETLAHALRQSVRPLVVLRVYARSLRHRRYLAAIGTLSLSFAGLFLYIAGAPTVIYEFLGLGSEDFGLQFIPMVAGMMLGSLLSARLARLWPAMRTIDLGLGVMAAAVLFNLGLAVMAEATLLSVIAPLVLYALGLALAMPPLTILALDCFPHHRGAATSMLGFVQMLMNAAVASVAVPLLHTHWLHFALGQSLFLALALLLWFRRTPAPSAPIPSG